MGLRCAALCCAVLCCAVLCCAVLCCAVLCCAVLCCAVLCCAVLCCAVLCCSCSSEVGAAEAFAGCSPTILVQMHFCKDLHGRLLFVPCLQPAQTASPKPVRPVTKKLSPEHDSHLAPPASPKYVRPANKKSIPAADSLPLATASGEGSEAVAASAAGKSNSKVGHPVIAQTLLFVLTINCAPTELALAAIQC